MARTLHKLTLKSPKPQGERRLSPGSGRAPAARPAPRVCAGRPRHSLRRRWRNSRRHWSAGGAGARGAEPEPAVAGGGASRGCGSCWSGGRGGRTAGGRSSPGAPWCGAAARPQEEPEVRAAPVDRAGPRCPELPPCVGPPGARAGPPWGPCSGARRCAWRSSSCSRARPTSASAPWARRAWSSSET